MTQLVVHQIREKIVRLKRECKTMEHILSKSFIEELDPHASFLLHLNVKVDAYLDLMQSELGVVRHAAKNRA